MLVIETDVTDEAAARAMVERTVGEFGRLDTLVNNAGVMLLGPILDAPVEEWRRMVELNVLGLLYCTHAALPHLLRGADREPRHVADVVNVSSVAGRVARQGNGVYSATKFALNAVGKAARVELKESGIHVLTVCPGYVRTDFGVHALRGGEKQQVRPSSVRGISPDRVARAVLRGYLKQKREVVVPWTMHSVIKAYQLVPGLVEWVMEKLMARRKD